MKRKHGWNTWENHLKVHESVLKRYQDFFVTQNPRYQISKPTTHFYQMKLDHLQIKTFKANIVFVYISKDIEIQDGARKKISRTDAYTFQAWTKNAGSLIRYCSPHQTHNKFHHKHDYTTKPETLIKIGDDQWPHVSEFFDEIIQNF